MADDINKTISIDVQINNDGQQQVNQYKAAFDSLRGSISNLSTPLNNLSNGIVSLDKATSKMADAVSKLSDQNKALASSGNKVKEGVKEVADTFEAWGVVSKILKASVDFLKDGIVILGEEVSNLEIALTGGLAIITVFGPELLKWIGELFKGDTTLKSLNQTLRDHKKVLEAVNQARLQGDQNAQEELVHAKLLYSVSQDHNLSLKERKHAVSELQAQYPAYFGNISAELILTGRATTAYNNLASAIIAASRAKAADDMLVKNSERQLGDKAKEDDITNKIKEKQEELADAAKEFQDTAKKSDRGRGSFNDAAYEKMQSLREEIKALREQSSHATTDALILDKQNDALIDVIKKNSNQTNRQVLGNLDGKINKRSIKSAPGNSVPKNDLLVDPAQKAPVQLDTGLSDADLAGLNISDDNTQKNIDAITKMEFDALKKRADAEEAARKTKAEADKKFAQDLKDLEIKTAGEVATAAFDLFNASIKRKSDAKVAGLEQDKATELSNSSLTSAQKLAIEQKYKKQENQVKVKAFKDEQKVSEAQAIINGAIAITKAEAQTGVLGALVIPGIIAETAIQVAKIASQKPPAYARGGLHYHSDGRGGVLPGYSSTDNTNAYLRSGEGVVVSEAMRVPWARNLVSAVNVGFGGRDFSMANSGRGYAVGGIFTDGGDANRYYNQPVNDQKNLANTIAYQMINNFPPVYVDVKDVNNQQNILAQTINRVNL